MKWTPCIANVTLISNANCAKILSHNASNDQTLSGIIKRQLSYGVVEQLVCSLGIKNETTGEYSVSQKILYIQLNC